MLEFIKRKLPSISVGDYMVTKEPPGTKWLSEKDKFRAETKIQVVGVRLDGVAFFRFIRIDGKIIPNSSTHETTLSFLEHTYVKSN
jgi:hypothetical protein